MVNEQEKTTVPIPSVGADGEQPLSNDTCIITADDNEINYPDDISDINFEELQRRLSDPSYLHAINMTELFNTVYEDAKPIVENLLYPGVYIFAGNPKIGKSYVMLQIAYQICTGSPLWGQSVRQGTCLYLALEDKYSRLQRRLYQMYDANPTDKLYLATLAKQISEGLDKQIEGFVKEHPDTRLVIIDTLQRVRPDKSSARNEYAADYEVMVPLKELADRLDICVLLVHHTRKLEAADVHAEISGTNGLRGAVDGTFVFKRSYAGDEGKIFTQGRDIPEQILHLLRDNQTMVWNLDHIEKDNWKLPPEPVLTAIGKLITPEHPEWTGTATALVELLGLDMKPNTLTMKLNINTSRLLEEYSIRYKSSRTHAGRRISLTLISAAA